MCEKQAVQWLLLAALLYASAIGAAALCGLPPYLLKSNFDDKLVLTPLALDQLL
jgi:hypothetical protein